MCLRSSTYTIPLTRWIFPTATLSFVAVLLIVWKKINIHSHYDHLRWDNHVGEPRRRGHRKLGRFLTDQVEMLILQFVVSSKTHKIYLVLFTRYTDNSNIRNNANALLPHRERKKPTRIISVYTFDRVYANTRSTGITFLLSFSSSRRCNSVLKLARNFIIDSTILWVDRT